MSEENLISIRKSKHETLNGGTYPIASEFSFDIKTILKNAFSHNVPTSLDPKDIKDKTYHAHGRLIAFRRGGGISFGKITDTTAGIQLIFSKAAYADYANLNLLDIGDILDAEGYAVISKTGEKSLLVTKITVLTKAHRAPPEKWNGIADTELKYRKRYLDLMSDPASRAVVATRAMVLKTIRSCLDDMNFMEVETSTLSSVASGANAKPFTTHHNALGLDLCMRIAPELNLKRLVVGGLDRVYEIGRNYRNEGISTRHNPEFTMLEFYQAYGTFEELIDYTTNLLRTIDHACATSLPLPFRNQYLEWRDHRTFSIEEFVVLPMVEAVFNGLSKIGFTIGDDFKNPIRMSGVTDRHLARREKINLPSLTRDLEWATSVGERISVLFDALVEPFLVEDYRTKDGERSASVIITNFPKDISPLARANDDDPTICDRLELYVDGRELCNAFQELNDPKEQALRFKEQLETNKKDPMDYDADYIEALEYGLPPTIGFGMGIDRLIILLTNSQSIKDVILFPTLKPDIKK